MASPASEAPQPSPAASPPQAPVAATDLASAAAEKLMELPARAELPPEIREALAARMLRHGEQMTGLMVGVLLLDYELVVRLASDLAREPKLGRPAPNERRTLNALLPSEFFVYQDALAQSAKDLAKAAEMDSDERIADAFGGLAKSCVGCHSAYLHEDLNMSFEHGTEPGRPLPECEDGSDCNAEPARQRRGAMPEL
jgi:hypothetical protein